jgi:hypothetical protein
VTKSIDAESLTTFEVTSDGARVRFNGRDADGAPVSMSLPANCMQEMMMTLPRIAQEALRRLHGDQSLSVVYPAGEWALRKGKGSGQPVIVTLATTDGFEVSFGFDTWQLRSFLTSISAAVELTSRAASIN